jgi:hypothetical protein
VTSQGHPRTIFRRAIEHGNLILAEGMARELGQVTLAEALELTALVAQKDPPRHSRYAVRWLRRLLDEHERLTIEEATLAASALLALGGPSSEQAYTTLSTLAEAADGRRACPPLAS